MSQTVDQSQVRFIQVLIHTKKPHRLGHHDSPSTALPRQTLGRLEQQREVQAAVFTSSVEKWERRRERAHRGGSRRGGVGHPPVLPGRRVLPAWRRLRELPLLRGRSARQGAGLLPGNYPLDVEPTALPRGDVPGWYSDLPMISTFS